MLVFSSVILRFLFLRQGLSPLNMELPCFAGKVDQHTPGIPSLLPQLWGYTRFVTPGI